VRSTIVLATASGTPRWRSPQALIRGPSLTRKKRLSAVKARNTASDASALMPVSRPSMSARKPSLTDELASSLALRAVCALTPRSSSQPLDLVGRVLEVAGQAAALAADAGEDQHAERQAEHDVQHEHQHRASRARHPPALQVADERREYRCEDRGNRYWDDDVSQAAPDPRAHRGRPRRAGPSAWRSHRSASASLPVRRTERLTRRQPRERHARRESPAARSAEGRR
jgi:hypothetical protein